MGKVKGIDFWGPRVAGQGTRNRGDRREGGRSLGDDVSNLVLETIEESCACGEDRSLIRLR